MTQAVTRLIVLASLLSAPTTAQHDAHNAHGNPPPKVFESEDRAEWQRPEWVINQLGLVPTEVVTDTGAGSRYFSRRIARRLTGGGRVIAVDIDPTVLTFLADRAKEAGIPNIDTSLVGPSDPGLDPSSVDVVFLTNTLHHIADRPAYYRHMLKAFCKDTA